MAFAARIILDSISPEGVRLTTFEVTFPRFILSEFNTHRTFSRNSASSRAIPLNKTLDRVRADPFIPTYWGKNQKGMQAYEELSAEAQSQARAVWAAALHDAIRHAEQLAEIGVHKQLANRILEPYMWHTALVTATEWSNFFALRAHEAAQPEIRTIAELMLAKYSESEPQQLGYDGWHMPLVRPEEQGELDLADLKKISSGRCARVSYLTHDGLRDLGADIKLHDQLVAGGHMSPLEHIARPMTKREYEASLFEGNFRGWHQYRKDVPYEHDYKLAQMA